MQVTTLGELDVRITGGDDGNGDGDGPVVVLLHGFGAPGDDLVPMWRALRGPAGTRYVFPAAPLSLGPGYAGGRAWWWINLEERIRRQAAGDADTTEIPEGLTAARAKVTALLAAVNTELRPPPGRVVLGGFSQGAMLSLDVALHTEAPLAGLLLFSGSHIASEDWAPRLAGRRGLPVFMSHGREDPILPFPISERLAETLRANGLEVEWLPFRGGHGIPPEALALIAAFLGRTLGDGP
jgi:phospholipase/carboxylesterase